MKKNENIEYTTKEKVNIFETTSPLFNSLYKEIQDLSKKKPDGTLNESKVKLINRLLNDIKDFLIDEQENKYLDILSDENLPQYSDVVLILSQYSAALQKFKSKYYVRNEISCEYNWLIK
ncbi:MAG: hypothetical protein A2086_12800 [Spirochaetes bacterium GWD1_27_9]|nr:MAG: hypothetical protein A2Z98_17935 [Spirochaetes bacterium GWB1_27_13]OHD24022.1 MAG: hypothetical protein A2Y34_13965 [Spirochaetes bacterium GWC1_27_15]OHD43956.1 MAG: hypothetical protein A2086_12800 [Spirochaetes bacterium GWD1_27_9]